MSKYDRLFRELMFAWLKTPMHSPAFEHIENAKDLFKDIHNEERSSIRSDEASVSGDDRIYDATEGA